MRKIMGFDEMNRKLILPEGVAGVELGPGLVLLRGSQPVPMDAPNWGPVSLPGLRRFVAWTLTSYFVTSPFFGVALPTVPSRCQVLLWEEDSGGFGVLVPVLDGDYRSEAFGMPEGLGLSSSCGVAGTASTDVALAIVHFAEDPFEALRAGMEAAVRWMQRGKLRLEKSTPRWVDLLGWCTWDAFYTEVDEEKILAGLEAFRLGGIVPGQMIIDEGWQDANAKMYLQSLGWKAGAFTGDGLRTLVGKARHEFGVKMIGCWRTLFGELRGVDVEAPGLSQFRRRLVAEPGTERDTFGVIEPEDVPRFHDEYGARLAEEGVDFVKVDFQSALHLMTYEQKGRAEAARLWQHSLQDSVEKHFHGEMLNCMAMGSGEVFHTRMSNVCRASDDYFPTRDDSHPAHIRQNLYNALWLSELQWPDWDMFHSRHPWAWYHAVGRAISGGPVYVSDKPGQSDFALLRRFVAADGKVLRCSQPALPTRNTVFADPFALGSTIQAFNRCGHIGLLAVFHPSADAASVALQENLAPSQVEALAGERFAVYSLRGGFLGVIARGETIPVTLQVREADLLVFSPIKMGFAAIGLVDKMPPPASLRSVENCADGVVIETRGGGRFGFFSENPVREIRLNDRLVPFGSEGRFFTVETGDHAFCRITVCGIS